MEFKESWDAARLEEEEVFTGGGSWGKYQQKLWDLFDKPHSSLAARMVALTSSLFIFLSVTILTLATLPTFTTENGEDYQPFAICEAAATLWFSLEFVVRLAASPDKKKKIFGN